jgi:hypothetical protein
MLILGATQGQQVVSAGAPSRPVLFGAFWVNPGRT